MPSIIERTATVADALAVAGKKLEDVINPNDTKDVNAYRVIKEVIAVLNEDWKADYSNGDQVKYEPYWYYKSGFGLSYGGYVYWRSGSRVGVRLCYRSREILKHGVEILKDYYNDFLNP
jgi:hypothetical protein